MKLTGDTLEDKLRLNHLVVDGGCWRWTGAHTTRGYGQIIINKKPEGVHRAAHVLWLGPIPDGFVVDHVWEAGCRHLDCINPEHLEAVTQQENVLRSLESRSWKVQRKVRTHCSKGHALEGSNLRTQRVGTYIRRICRTCLRGAS